MQLSDFRSLIDRLQAEVSPEYLDGIVDVEVSPKTVPHPLRDDIYTLGECIPLEWSGSGADLQSRVVLYHGSFQALARLGGQGGFDWREEAWETLMHELRHHLEWRANVAELEALDWAAEQNYARHEGDTFDPVFYRNGEAIAAGVFKVEDDVFIEAAPAVRRGAETELVWHGRRYTVATPAAGSRAFVFVTIEGLDEPPPGEVLLVLPGAMSVWDLLRGPAAPVQGTVRAMAADG